jgi:site-specific recombinase XerD
MTPEQFIKERTYLTGVTPKTISWYEQSFKRFAGALESKEAITDRIAQLKERGLSHISINTHLRCINAYFRWLHLEHHSDLLRLPKLKEEQKIISTFSPEQISRIVRWKAHGSRLRLKALALSALDTGLRVEELLTLTRSSVDLGNLTLRVKGKGNKHRLVPVSMELRKVLTCPR